MRRSREDKNSALRSHVDAALQVRRCTSTAPTRANGYYSSGRETDESDSSAPATPCIMLINIFVLCLVLRRVTQLMKRSKTGEPKGSHKRRPCSLSRALIGSFVFLWPAPLPVILRFLGGLCSSGPGWLCLRACLAPSPGPRLRLLAVRPLWPPVWKALMLVA
jgi:hypothetical protein